MHLVLGVLSMIFLILGTQGCPSLQILLLAPGLGLGPDQGPTPDLTRGVAPAQGQESVATGKEIE